MPITSKKCHKLLKLEFFFLNVILQTKDLVSEKQVEKSLPKIKYIFFIIEPALYYQKPYC